MEYVVSYTGTRSKGEVIHPLLIHSITLRGLSIGRDRAEVEVSICYSAEIIQVNILIPFYLKPDSRLEIQGNYMINDKVAR